MEFPVQNNSFAAYLIATQRLRLLRIEATVRGSNIIFDDPKNEGAAIELEYLAGAVVSAVSYQNCLRTLRRSVEIKLAEARKGGATCPSA